jgi:hypothetical protein
MSAVLIVLLSDTQTISAQGNVLKPLQPSGRHYVSLPTDTQSHSAATCDVSSAGDIAITRPSLNEESLILSITFPFCLSPSGLCLKKGIVECQQC